MPPIVPDWGHSTHGSVYFYVQRLTRELTARRFGVVEIGARDVNGSVRPLFAGQDYTGVDIAPGNNVDVVADGATFGEAGAYDLGLCLETLEHAPNAGAIVANLCRIVRPGGLVIVTAATDPRAPHSAVDGAGLRDGEHYGNIAPADLLTWLAPCDSVTLELDRGHGDVRACGWVRA